MSSATTLGFCGSVSDISCSDILTSEVVAQRELNLTISAQAHGAFDCLPQQAKRAAGRRLRKCGVRLEARRNNTGRRDRRQRVVQRRCGNSEVRLVEDVEDLRAKLNVRRLTQT